jgi:hypothetical protein
MFVALWGSEYHTSQVFEWSISARPFTKPLENQTELSRLADSCFMPPFCPNWFLLLDYLSGIQMAN